MKKTYQRPQMLVDFTYRKPYEPAPVVYELIDHGPALLGTIDRRAEIARTFPIKRKGFKKSQR